MNKNLCTNGFLLIFKIYFFNIHGTPSHLSRGAPFEITVLGCDTAKSLWIKKESDSSIFHENTLFL
jgi:hypothetical protein